MLILRRKEGQWLEITHRSGDVIRIRVCNVRARYPGQVDLVLDDGARNFVIQRPERTAQGLAAPLDTTLLLASGAGEPGPGAMTPVATAGAL